MRRFFALAIAVLGFAACNNESETEKKLTDSLNNQQTSGGVSVLTEEEKAAGWIALFDGSTTAGWHKYGGEPVGSAWKVADGALYLDTTNKSNGKIVGGGDIVTDESFENFHLKLEWKISPGGNSGIIFYVLEDSVAYKHSYETGPEMQVLDNERHPDGKITKHRAGDLYDLISCSKETVKPVGEWNQVEIKSDHGQLDFFLNGENVVSTKIWDDNWAKMIANSKFKQWPSFGTITNGKICLQDHDNLVWYRNIRIKRLPGGVGR